MSDPEGGSDTALLRPLSRLAGRDDALGRLAGRVATSFLVRCLLRFVRISGRDRILVLAGQAFTTLVPLLILIAAVGSDDAAVSRRIISRFGLTGEAADAVRSLFSRPPGTTGTITVVGALVLLFSLLSFTRSLQRTYEAAWELPSTGVRGTLNGLSGVSMLIAQVIILSLLAGAMRGLPAASFNLFVLRVLVASLLWWQLQRLLLSRRVTHRQLVPGAIAAGLGQVVVSVYSATWMPHQVNTNAERYGVIGVTFALLTWLIVISAGIVVAAVVSAEAGRKHLTVPAQGHRSTG